jgi:peptide/nickel transport system permease protein
MLTLVVRRLCEALAVLALVSAAVFAMTEAAPGQFLSELRANPRISAGTIAVLEDRFDLNAPIHRRYASWVGSAFGGDFGFSALYQMPVADVMWPRLGNTLTLSGLALAIAWLAGAAFDRITAAGSSLLLATPDLVAGLAVVWVAAWTGWFPVTGSLLLPAIALAAVTAPVVFRHTRTAVIEALGSRAVLAARLHGLSARAIAFTHVLPLAAIPLVPLFALSMASLLSASLVIEVIVAWPGLGPLMLDAVLGRDLHLLVASAVMSAGLLVAASTGSDLLLCWIDPRARSARR